MAFVPFMGQNYGQMGLGYGAPIFGMNQQYGGGMPGLHSPYGGHFDVNRYFEQNNVIPYPTTTVDLNNYHLQNNHHVQPYHFNLNNYLHINDQYHYPTSVSNNGLQVSHSSQYGPLHIPYNSPLPGFHEVGGFGGGYGGFGGGYGGFGGGYGGFGGGYF